MHSSMKAAGGSSGYVRLELVHIHTHHNFLFAGMSEFLWWIIWFMVVYFSVFRVTWIVPACYYATVLLTWAVSNPGYIVHNI